MVSLLLEVPVSRLFPSYSYFLNITFLYFKIKIYNLQMDAKGSLLMIFFCFRVPVELFGSPGISNCHATIVSVESSFLLLHSIKMKFIGLP